ncbi:hypothetical protein EAH89_29925 [Roseomonas nepalensis]|uniref:Uncharacterized protein n=2 Tax=Muricoccus nepalensis TaxID=1854500 RepID=A0A502EIX2_9PROT|nr:hypothetical protein EAH89_29925 [Roseomonas nepalensis]
MMDGGAESSEDLQKVVARAVAGALDVMLKRTAPGERLTLIRTLRAQMEQVLAEAPLTGDPVEAIAMRTRLAALFDAEFTRREAAEQRPEQP